MTEFQQSHYLSVFMDELDEQVQILEEQLLILENDGSHADTIQRIFRAAHTLKGSSSAMGLEHVKQLTHHMENVFDLIRQNMLQADSGLITVMFSCTDFLKACKMVLAEGRKDELDYKPLLEQLAQYKQNTNQQSIVLNPVLPAMVKNQEQQLFIQLSEEEAEQALKMLHDQFRVLILFLLLDHDTPMKSVRSLLIGHHIHEFGNVIVNLTNPEQVEEESKVAFIIATKYTDQAILQDLNAITDVKSVQIRPVVNDQLEPFIQGQLVKFRTAEADAIRTPNISPLETNASPEANKIKMSQTVRVDVDRLEILLNLVGELVIDNTRLLDVKRKISEEMKNSNGMLEFDEITNHLGRVISELQTNMMKTRMYSVEPLFNRFPRMVRDLALQSNKEVEFMIEGKETELDRTLIEEIGDPIIHMLRNSIDHGIELPHERVASGKPRKGTLMLKATHQENQIVITISDDGKGINPAKIKESAIQKGLIQQAEAEHLTDKEILFLIFKSGFSTASQITDISGRGVGMDIVKSHVEKLNGIVDIDTTVGEGTQFTIKLPLTLAIIRALLVKLGDRTFALPLVNVMEILRMKPEDIKIINHQEVCVIRERILPLIRLHEKLGIPASETHETENKNLYCVVLGFGEQRVCLLVDRTIGNQEIVIKSLGKFIGSIPYISGSTILGGGNVAPILDVGSIVKGAGASIHHENEQKHSDIKKSREEQWITFHLGEEEYGMNIRTIKDIMMIPPMTKVQTASPIIHGMMNLRGSLLPVVDVRKCLDLKESLITKRSRIIVTEVAGKDVGIIVDDVNEVVKVYQQELEAVPEHICTKKSKFIANVCKKNHRLIMMLDIENMLQEYQYGAVI